MHLPIMWTIAVVIPVLWGVQCGSSNQRVSDQSEAKTKESTMTESTDESAVNDGSTSIHNKVIKSDAEWRQSLTPEQYEVLRKAGTERPYTGQYNDHYECHLLWQG